MADPSAELAKPGEVAAPPKDEWRRFPDDVISICFSGTAGPYCPGRGCEATRLSEVGHR